MEANQTRDELRSKLMASANRRRQTVTLKAGAEPIAVEVRQPSIVVRNRILSAGGIKSTGDNPTIQAGEEMKWAACLNCAFDPASGAKLLEAADKECFFDQPALFDELAGHCLAMLTPSAEDAEKNSETTPSNG